MLDEFYQVSLRKKIHRDIDELQKDLDHWVYRDNHVRVHQGKTPMETFEENLTWQERRFGV